MKGLKPLMSLRQSAALLLGSALVLPLAPAIAQNRPAPVAAQPAAPVMRPQPPVARPPAMQNPALPAPNAAPQPEAAPPAPPPLPPVVWDPVSAQDLVYYIQQIGKEGLEPADYDPAGLQAAIASGDPVRMSQEATARFNRVSNDLALGHVTRSARLQWFVVDKDLDAVKQDALLRTAIAQRNIRGALDGLLPTHPQYAALKAALEMTPATQTAKADRIKLNMTAQHKSVE